MLCRCPVLAVAKAFVCLSVCVSLSHLDTVSKRRKLESRDLHPQVSEGL